MIQVSTSVLCVNDEKYLKTFYNIETGKTDFFHIDVMDGNFVEENNIGKMKNYALEISQISNTPLDIHLMCKNVKKIAGYFIDLSPDRITFHIEAMKDKDETLAIINYLKDNGIKVGIAISPNTKIDEVLEFLPLVHMCLVMTVEPGKGGQKLIPETIDKVKALKKYLDDNDIDIDIEVDGGINGDNSLELIESGASILVSGKYIVDSGDYSEAIKKLKNI